MTDDNDDMTGEVFKALYSQLIAYEYWLHELDSRPQGDIDKLFVDALVELLVMVAMRPHAEIEPDRLIRMVKAEVAKFSTVQAQRRKLYAHG